MSRSCQREVEEWEQAREDYYDDQLEFYEGHGDRELQYLTGGNAVQLEQSEQIEREVNWQQQQRDFSLVEQLEQSEQWEQEELLKQVESYEEMKHSLQQQQSSSSSQE
jgi:hypothetical protein